MIHDDSGQILNASYIDYYLPGATEVLCTEVAHIEAAKPLNPLACKGWGEGRTIHSQAAVVLAIEVALSDLKTKVNCLPVTPEALLNAISDAKASRL